MSYERQIKTSTLLAISTAKQGCRWSLTKLLRACMRPWIEFPIGLRVYVSVMRAQDITTYVRVGLRPVGDLCVWRVHLRPVGPVCLRPVCPVCLRTYRRPCAYKTCRCHVRLRPVGDLCVRRVHLRPVGPVCLRTCRSCLSKNL